MQVFKGKETAEGWARFNIISSYVVLLRHKMCLGFLACSHVDQIEIKRDLSSSYLLLAGKLHVLQGEYNGLKLHIHMQL